MRPNIFPALRYHDGHAAIDWLVRVFGFEAAAVFETPDGGVGHAELRLGTGLIAVNSAASTPPGSPWSGVGQGIHPARHHLDRVRLVHAPSHRLRKGLSIDR